MTCCVPDFLTTNRDVVLPQANLMFEFLMVLYPDDLTWTYLKCIHIDKKKHFLKQSKHMNGYLHICQIENTTNSSNTKKRVCECCNAPYAIRGLITRNMLYAKLPKEGTYVSFDTWYHEYLKSQMMELLYIFRMLGAMDIHLTLEKNLEDKGSIAVEGGVSFPGIFSDVNVNAGIKNNTVKQCSNSIDLSATYDTDDKDFKPYEQFNDFIVDKRIFYLNQRQDWQDMITQRLDCGIKELKFAFTVSNNLQVEKAFFANVQKLGLNIEYRSDDIASFTVTGLVTF